MKVSVCIPTRNRPDDVVQCVASIRLSSIPVHEIIVTDDSTDGRTRTMVHEHCPDVLYLEGPRRGLGPNRNNAIEAATGDWVLFLDDDARLTPDFLAILAPLVQEQHGNKVIFTGIERNSRGLVYPNDQDFLGFQSVGYGETESVIRTLVVNSALFPMDLLRTVRFDPNLVYGYDEIDIAARALARGYTIRLCRDAVNLHFSSPLQRDFNAPHIESSRIYVTYRKYRESQGRPLKAAFFLVLSLLHSVASQLKRRGLAGLSAALKTHTTAWRQIRRATS
jgi:GT2 family glycosyltransferase